MASRPIGLDWFDLLIHGGITFALAVAAASTMRNQEEFGLGVVVAASLGILAWRRSRALRHGPPVSTGEIQAERILELEERLGELESQQARLLELEERLDFAERMLTRQRDVARLPGAGEGQ